MLKIDFDSYAGESFYSDKMPEVIEEMKAKGVTIHSGPFQPNPQVKFFYVLDPNGLRVQFVERH